MKKIAALAALLIAIVLLLTACGDDLAGTWVLSAEGHSAIWTFSGGTLTIETLGEKASGSYEADDGTVTLTEGDSSLVCSYKVANKTLTLTYPDGRVVTLTQQ